MYLWEAVEKAALERRAVCHVSSRFRILYNPEGLVYEELTEAEGFVPVDRSRAKRWPKASWFLGLRRVAR